MFLYPYKIFAISKNKRLLNIKQQYRTVGIYDVDKYNYTDVLNIVEKYPSDDYRISVMLGKVCGNTRLICLDLDDCFDEETGEMEPSTKEFLEEFNESEYEISSSGTGVHVYVLTNMDIETFIVKNLEGCKSFECYTGDRHIVTTFFDFQETNLRIGKHDDFIKNLYNRVKELREAKLKESTLVTNAKNVFDGTVIKTEQDFNSKIYKRTPVTDMYTLRGLGFKDPMIISVIDENPDAVDQSAHDAKLIRKLMYYTLSFDSAWEMAKKTNYYKAKDDRHKRKFNDEKYIQRTKNLIERGWD
jgi:hypothetical protein